jgi:ParB family transcriptional regulator, chromosome partitioning protein
LGVITLPGRYRLVRKSPAATREAMKVMPKDGGKLRVWLMQQDQRRLLAFLAIAPAHTVDAVEKKFNGADRASADRLATALKLDMADYWQATAEGFFSRVSKDQTLAALTEAASETVSRGMAAMKKAELAAAAEKAVRGNGWLPAILQNKLKLCGPSVAISISRVCRS